MKTHLPFTALLLFPALAAPLFAGDENQVEIAKQGGFVPKIANASDEGQNAIQKFSIAAGLQARLWAAEPLLANPVAFATDEKGRWYVSETFRLHAGVSDIRAHMNWLQDELASKTLDSFLAILKGDAKVDLEKNGQNSERVQLVWDSKGTGKADSSRIFAEGFNAPLDGIAAGILARKGSVYLTSIPDLWLLKDTKDAKTADHRQSLARGFGIRTGFLGHDLHGLRMGPDGRLYFTVGDRGGNAKGHDGSTAYNPETGAVYRCEPDGTGLELFAIGLRNPQELAFDQYGNLFTGDNNSDASDPARWVYVLPGSDSGWRIGWQFLGQPVPRGPWLGERLCYPAWKGQPAYHLPPVAVLGNGPSGLTYHPGTGLGDTWKEHFFLANFSGSTNRSGIFAVTVSPQGAGFRMSEPQKPVWDMLPTDVEFGVDGSLYVLDWVQGWGMNGKGRIYAFSHEKGQTALEKETQKLIGEGMEKRDVAELSRLLAHADMRIRQEAQFELAARKQTGALRNAAQKGATLQARLHGIWGLGQLARKDAGAAESFAALLRDADPEVRAQAAKTARELPKAALEKGPLYEALMAALEDSSERVRAFAAITLGKAAQSRTIEPLLAVLRKDQTNDPVLRHAVAIGLANSALPSAPFVNGNALAPEAAGSESGIRQLSAAARKDAEPRVRIGAVVALRRLRSPELAAFLTDSDPLVVAEAVRAIHDEHIDSALPAVAALANRMDEWLQLPAGTREEPGPRDGLVRRVLNANYRVGGTEQIRALLGAAGREDLAESLRQEVFQGLTQWEKPFAVDRVTGLYRPLPERNPRAIIEPLEAALGSLLQSASASAQIATLKLAASLKLPPSALKLRELLANTQAAPAVRAEALHTMAALQDPETSAAIQTAAGDKAEPVRKEALRLQLELKLPGALQVVSAILEKGSLGEKQNALTALAHVEDPAAAALAEGQMDQLLQGKLRPELELEVLEAANRFPALRTKLDAHAAALPAGNEMAPYRFALQGGNASEGKKVFYEKAEAMCMRCHKIKKDGAEVGPELTGIGARQTREYLLESIVNPNAKIAEGFDSLLVTLTDGSIQAGIRRAESEAELQIMPPTGKLARIPKARIKSVEKGPSGMPPLAAVLSKRELRDLIEFLASQR
jgi:quinoprotein glucose dehydrogenase